MSDRETIFRNLGLTDLSQGNLDVFSPIDGTKIGSVQMHEPSDIVEIAQQATAAFHEWREVPAPVRGKFVRFLGKELRASKEDLGGLVTIETGKILSEGLGEVQEMIDICDFAVGLSRQLYGKTMTSERPGHNMKEVWHPLGPVGIISAFNFPVAVWSWNAAIAWVAGDSTVWKPSEKAPLTSLACQEIFNRAAQKFREAGHAIPEHLSQLFIGARDVGIAMVDHSAFPLISATGSVPMGRDVAVRVAKRLGRSLLELGGNNGTIVMPSAKLDDEALNGILFGATGTAGQRCTTLRRLIVHKDIHSELIQKLVRAYGSILSRIGDPLDESTLVGPLIDEQSYEAMQRALRQAEEEGGKILVGGKRVKVVEGGVYVQPALVEMPEQTPIVHHETFAPILYVMKCQNLEEAIRIHNGVPQGLSSSIMTGDVEEEHVFLGAVGSDCGIANVNIGTSGAEIGGAFGGEKETGGGRESGSDAWQAYMRLQTQTTRYTASGALAQGVEFKLDLG